MFFAGSGGGDGEEPESTELKALEIAFDISRPKRIREYSGTGAESAMETVRRRGGRTNFLKREDIYLGVV